MDEWIRLCGAALILLVCLSLLRDKAPSMGLVTALCGTAVLAALLLPMAERALDCARWLMEATGLDSRFFSPVARVVGICLVGKLSAELCRDAGERALALSVEMGGAIAGILCAAPLVEEALRLIRVV